MKISAIVITKNEERKIADCLDSLAWVDEIVVVDDGSIDATAAICLSRGVRPVSHPFRNFSDQKQYAMSLASHEWILEIDADERPSEEMKRSIQALRDNDLHDAAAFSFPRRTRFWGDFLRYGKMYPDRKVRLYHARRGRWSDNSVHERFIPEGKVRPLRGDILHLQDLDLHGHFARAATYAGMAASDYRRRGKKGGIASLLLHPLHAFWYSYVFRLGFLDGIRGFLMAAVTAYGCFAKYAILLELHQSDPEP